MPKSLVLKVTFKYSFIKSLLKLYTPKVNHTNFTCGELFLYVCYTLQLQDRNTITEITDNNASEDKGLEQYNQK